MECRFTTTDHNAIEQALALLQKVQNILELKLRAVW